MAARRDWESLSDAYRRRLERKGITQATYDRGVSLAGARGHSETPERPERAGKNPDRYASYIKGKKGIRVYTRNGVEVVAGLTKSQRSVVGRHWNAVKSYLDGDTEPLTRFEGRIVAGRYLMVDGGAIEDAGMRGEIEYDDIYEK